MLLSARRSQIKNDIFKKVINGINGILGATFLIGVFYFGIKDTFTYRPDYSKTNRAFLARLKNSNEPFKMARQIANKMDDSLPESEMEVVRSAESARLSSCIMAAISMKLDSKAEILDKDATHESQNALVDEILRGCVL